MAGSSAVDIDSAVSTQELPAIPDTDDIFLTVPRTEFISELSDLCSVTELR